MRCQSIQATPLHPSGRFAEPDGRRPGTSRQDPDVNIRTFVHQKNHNTILDHTNETGISNTWAAWATAHQNPALATSAAASLPLSAQDASYNESIDSQVKHILATPVHNLGKGNHPPFDFPYKYILRGPERVKACINSVTLLEHLWGIFRMIHDPKTNADIKPCLILHVEQIVEDARKYEWEVGVRRWSEEVFSRISEGRLVNGWHATQEIQRLRMIIAQSKPFTARAYSQSQPRDNSGRRHLPQAQPQSEILKGGPPCPDFNCNTGCTLKSGHIKDGKRLVHVCSFCLINTSAANSHPEAYCRNKVRLGTGHPHFQ